MQTSDNSGICETFEVESIFKNGIQFINLILHNFCAFRESGQNLKKMTRTSNFPLSSSGGLFLPFGYIFRKFERREAQLQYLCRILGDCGREIQQELGLSLRSD
jgi:hypothetical protein